MPERTAVSDGTGRAALLRLLTRPSGWRRIRLFGAAPGAPHTRRRSDLITLLCAALLLAAIVPTARTTTGVELALYETFLALPTVMDPLLALVYDLLALWAVGIVLLALVRGHWRLVVSMALTVPVGVAMTVAVDAGLGLDGRASDLALGAPVDGAPIQLVLAAGLASLGGRELSSPFRAASRRLLGAALLAALLLPVSAPYRVVAAALVAIAATALVRFVVGSPRAIVSAGDARDDLADLGVEAEPVEAWSTGVHEATTPDGERLAVRILGRDEWESQAASTFWRFLWYRNSGSGLLVTPRQRVEHHAFLLLLAQARGAAVTPVVAAGTSRTGDALVASRVVGPHLDELAPPELVEATLDACWASLRRLHDAGIAHCDIDGSALLVQADGMVALGSFERAQSITRVTQVHADRAQLLVTTAVVAGTERAVAAAARAIAEDDLGGATDLVSHVQTAALGGHLRRRVDEAHLSLEELRTALATETEIEVPELQRLWRVSWAALVRLGLLALVGYLLISQLADIGWETIEEAITSAAPGLLFAALLFGQVPRVASAASLQSASPTPVPLGRVTRLQFATSFVNLAVPSTAARVGVSIRFFQRSGATSGGAISAGALDGIAGFVAQIGLLVGFGLAGAGTLGWDGLSGVEVAPEDLVKVVLVLLGLLALAVTAVAVVRPLRERVLHLARQLKEGLAVLHSPVTVVRLIGFNVLAELLFAGTIWIVLRAFGQDVGFADVVIINEAVALFAGLMPVPGGVGVTEGALTAGFVAVGVPEGVAFSAALAYRMCTFYLPPLWGYVAFDSLRKDGYL